MSEEIKIEDERISANESAVPFYEKLGMKKAEDVMRYDHIEWAKFTVQ